MLNLNIQFNGFNDLAAFIQTLQTGSSVLSKQLKEEPKPEPQAGPPEVAPTPPQAEKRRGRSPKSAAPAPETPNTGAQDPTPPAPAEPVKAEVNEADVQKALEEVFNTKGMPTARDLLSRYGVKRLAELKREKYAEFVDHAKKVLAGEPV